MLTLDVVEWVLTNTFPRCTRAMIAERLGKFEQWMNGQTVAVAADGTTLYYLHDVQRWLAGLPCVD